MKTLRIGIGYFFLFIFLLLPCLFAQESPSLKWGLGLNYGGAQVDWRWTPNWMLELRAQQSSDVSNNLKTNSTVFGTRLYRFFLHGKKVDPYFGSEFALVHSRQEGSSYQASGLAAGAFCGLGFKLSPHLLFTLDAGPYFIDLKEKQTQAQMSEVNFVGDAALAYFF